MDATGLHDERYDEVDDIDRVRRLPSLQLAGSPERRTLDLNALSAMVSPALAPVSGAVTLRIPHNDGAALALCYERGRVLARVDEPQHVVVDVELPPAWAGPLAGYRVLN